MFLQPAVVSSRTHPQLGVESVLLAPHTTPVFPYDHLLETSDVTTQPAATPVYLDFPTIELIDVVAQPSATLIPPLVLQGGSVYVEDITAQPAVGEATIFGPLSVADVTTQPAVTHVVAEDRELNLTNITTSPYVTPLDGLYLHDILTADVLTSPHATPLDGLYPHDILATDVVTSPSVTHVTAEDRIIDVLDVTAQPDVTPVTPYDHILDVLDVTAQPTYIHWVLESRNTEAADVTTQPMVEAAAIYGPLLAADVVAQPSVTSAAAFPHDLYILDVTAQPMAGVAAIYGPISVADVVAQPSPTPVTPYDHIFEVLDVVTSPSVTHVTAEDFTFDVIDVTAQPNVTPVTPYDHDLEVLDVTAQPIANAVTPAWTGGILYTADVTTQPNASPTYALLDGVVALYHFNDSLEAAVGQDFVANDFGGEYGGGVYGPAARLVADGTAPIAQLDAVLNPFTDSFTLEWFAAINPFTDANNVELMVILDESDNVAASISMSSDIPLAVNHLQVLLYDELGGVHGGNSALKDATSGDFHHMAVVVNQSIPATGSTPPAVYVYNDGTRTVPINPIPVNMRKWAKVIGADTASARANAWYIDELRLSYKALYTEFSITPPAEEFDPKDTSKNWLTARSPIYNTPDITPATTFSDKVNIGDVTVQPNATSATILELLLDVQDVTLQPSITHPALQDSDFPVTGLWHFDGSIDGAVGNNWTGTFLDTGFKQDGVYGTAKDISGLFGVTAPQVLLTNYPLVPINDLTVECFIQVPDHLALESTLRTVLSVYADTAKTKKVVDIQVRRVAAGVSVIGYFYGINGSASYSREKTVEDFDLLREGVHVCWQISSTAASLHIGGEIATWTILHGNNLAPTAELIEGSQSSLEGRVFVDELRVSAEVVYVIGTLPITVPTEQFAPISPYLTVNFPVLSPAITPSTPYLYDGLLDAADVLYRAAPAPILSHEQFHLLVEDVVTSPEASVAVTIEGVVALYHFDNNLDTGLVGGIDMSYQENLHGGYLPAEFDTGATLCYSTLYGSSPGPSVAFPREIDLAGGDNGTIEFFMKPMTGVYTGIPMLFRLRTSSSVTGRFELRIVGAEFYIHVYVANTFGAKQIELNSPIAPWPGGNDNMAHVAFVIDDTSASLYLDGERVAHDAAIDKSICKDIGGIYGGNTTQEVALNGTPLIDEFRATRRAVYSGETLVVPHVPFDERGQLPPALLVADVTVQPNITNAMVYESSTVALWHLNDTNEKAVGVYDWETSTTPSSENVYFDHGRFGSGIDPHMSRLIDPTNAYSKAGAPGGDGSVDVNTTDYTVEFFHNLLQATTGTKRMFYLPEGQGGGLTAFYMDRSYRDSDGWVSYTVGSYGAVSNVALYTDWIAPPTRPVHIALVFSSTEIAFYFDGVKRGFHAKSTGYRTWGSLSILNTVARAGEETIDELRFSTAALYSGATITVPTERFPPSSDSKNYLQVRNPVYSPVISGSFPWNKLLTEHIYHFDGDGLDSKGSADFTFDGAQTYHTGKWGQGIELEASDYTEPHSWANITDLNPHTGDFSIECWSNLLSGSVSTYLEILRLADVEDGFGGTDARLAMMLSWAGNTGSRRPSLRIKQVGGSVTELLGDFIDLSSYPTEFWYFAIVCRSSAEKIDFYVNDTRKGSLNFSALSLRTIKSINAGNPFTALSTQTDEVVISSYAIYPDVTIIPVPTFRKE